MTHFIPLRAADAAVGVVILAFTAAALVMLLWTGIKSYEKRGILFIIAGASILLSFLFELVSNMSENTDTSLLDFGLLSHGFAVLAGILLSASFYLSKRAIEKYKEEAKP